MGGRPLLMAALPENTVATSPTPTVNPERPMIDVILECLDDAKAEDIVAVDITGKSSLADHMVVASGRSHRHVGAVADQLINALREAGYGKPRVEGLPHCDWVLVDTGDVIVHIFRPEVRDFYNIEKMWQADFAADAH
jgi:ribosome-associated protein